MMSSTDYRLPDSVDVDGYVDSKGVRYFGFATRQEDGGYAALADVGGCLCFVACSVTVTGPEWSMRSIP